MGILLANQIQEETKAKETILTAIKSETFLPNVSSLRANKPCMLYWSNVTTAGNVTNLISLIMDNFIMD